MILIVGPLYNGKRAFACRLMDWSEEDLAHRALCDVQTKAAQTEDLEALADELEKKEVLIATETGGGVVPVDAALRREREMQGRLLCLLAQRAEKVIRVFCGLPLILKEGDGQ